MSAKTAASNGNHSTVVVQNQSRVSHAGHEVSAPPPTAAGRPPTSLLFSRGNLVSSRLSGSDKASLARPSTAVRAVGYATNNNGSAGQRFDQVFLEKAKQQTLNSANASLDANKEINPQIKYKNLETKIVKLLESSILLAGTTTKLRNTGIGESHNNSTSANSEIKTTLTEALNKAKEAFSLDRTLHRFRDQHGENIFHNFDLTYAVFFNLAEQYEHNDLHIEALNTYSIMTKNKMFPHVNQLKLNMGNIYFRMGIYPKAIKMYRMALDSVPNNLKQLRLKITQNIGVLFVRMGQYADAAASFEFIMAERSDIRSGVHLILCYYAIGDIEKIKLTFRNLCDVQPMDTIENDLENESNIIKLQQHNNNTSIIDKDNHQHQQHYNEGPSIGVISSVPSVPSAPLPTSPARILGELGVIDGDTTQLYSAAAISSSTRNSANTAINGGRRHITGELKSEVLDGDAQPNATSKNRYVIKALKTDELAIYTKHRKITEKRAITMIVDLISPIIEENYNDGYNWCIEVIKTSNLAWLVNELELNKALVYLRQNDVNQAIETLQMYDRKSEGSMTASALTNLSFIYINLGNLQMAEHCINQLNDIGALQNNALALVNGSIIDFRRQHFKVAREKLERALEIQPDSFEANYNLGLVALQENDLELAKEQFEQLKVYLMVPHSVQHTHVYYQLAKLQERQHAGNGLGQSTGMVLGFRSSGTPAALQSYLQVLGISASEIDSRLFEKVGSIYEQMQDHQEANQYYNEAYRINPSDIAIASSIGSYYIKLQATEKALYYYERAVLANPNDPALMLRIASCFRHSYMPPKQYLAMFERIYARFPDNLSCVRALMQVTKSMGMTDLNERYSLEMARLQKLQTERQNEQRFQQQRLSSVVSGRHSNRLRAFRSERSTENTYNASRIQLEREEFSSGLGSGYHNSDPFAAADLGTAHLHSDPLGPPTERPRTGMLRSSQSRDSDDEEINANSLLPI